MRMITRLAAQAFYNGEPFNKDNTSVTTHEDVDAVRMYLHGNLIAKRDDELTLTVTFADWGTNTTRERINGLLAYYAERNHWPNCPVFYRKQGQYQLRDAGEVTPREVGLRDHINIDIMTGYIKSSLWG